MVTTTTLALSLENAAMRRPLSCRRGNYRCRRTGRVPIPARRNRRAITGCPGRTAACMGPLNRSGLLTETIMPAGCSATAFLKRVHFFLRRHSVPARPAPPLRPWFWRHRVHAGLRFLPVGQFDVCGYEIILLFLLVVRLLTCQQRAVTPRTSKNDKACEEISSKVSFGHRRARDAVAKTERDPVSGGGKPITRSPGSRDG